MTVKRKDFLKNISLGLTGLLLAPFAGRGRNSNPESETMKPKNTVLRVRPLGFVWDTADPFLFCVHHEDAFPKGNEIMGPAESMEGRSLGDDFIIKNGYRMYHGKRVPGFPGHPHRGFETVTVVRKGMVDHADSMGAAGRYGDGDVQWMTAGKGVQHSEMFPLLSREHDNPMELFQIWLNLPARNKMVAPHFKMMWREDIPLLTNADASGKTTKVELIAGALWGKQGPTPPPDSWAADAANEVAIWNLHLEPGASCTLPAASAGVNRTLYFYEGEKIQFAGTDIPKYSGVEVNGSEELLIQNGDHVSKVLVLQGRPIGEVVMQYGPFVMNTKEEIHQAFDDFHRTQFGGWPWPVPDQVHERSKGRFARHADGHVEEKG